MSGAALNADARGGERTAFRSDIQGLRAIAVGGVLLYHAGIPFVGGGFVGVDVFFVISGFLITSHLLRSLDRDGRIGFATFYARRARRILPASFVVLALTIAGILIWVPPSLQPGFLRDAAATAVYIPNIFFAIQGTDYLAETAPSPLQHYWSLGVEEQFYLFWPLLLMALWLGLRKRRPGIVLGTSLLAMGSFAAAVAMTFSALQPWAFFSLPTRAWELLVGALVAILVPWISRWRRPIAAVVGWLGIAVVAASMVLIDGAQPFPGVLALAPVLGTAAVIAAGTATRVPVLDAVLAWSPVQFIGRISYSLYLVHWPLLVIPATAGGAGTLLHGWWAVGITLLSVPLAWLLYRFVETPFQRARWSTRRRPRTVLVSALAASVVAISVSGGAAYGIANRPLDAGVANPRLVAVASPPQFSDVVPSNMTPSLADVAADLPATYADGCHVNGSSPDVPDGCSFGDTDAPTVVALFGDSHAAQWFPTLAVLGEREGFRLDSYTKSSCPAAEVVMVTDGVEDTSCAQWRASVVQRLQDAAPDVVVISGFARYDEYGTTSIDPATWNDGLAATIAAFPASTRVLVISDTPAFPATPATCLSVHLSDALSCSRPRAEAVKAGWAAEEMATATASGASVAEFTDYLCDAESCGLIIDDRLLYRDAHHLTATFVELLAPELWRELGPLTAP